METDVLIVGAGITGLTLANRFAGLGRTVTVIEARDHIGGNCNDVEHPAGITVQPYGPHIFHTQDQAVWAFLSRFTAWNQYRHKVLARTGDMYLPMPFNFNALDLAGSVIEEMLRKPLTNEAEAFSFVRQIHRLQVIPRYGDNLTSFVDLLRNTQARSMMRSTTV